MPRLDVYLVPDGTARVRVVDVQADLLAHLATRVVVPLVPMAGTDEGIAGLNPVFEFEGVAHVMQTQEILVMARQTMGPSVGSLDAHHDEITRALDILLLGF